MYRRPIRLSELAERLGCALEGDGSLVVEGVASLEDAGPRDLGFVRSKRYEERVRRTRAAAVVAPPDVDAGGLPVLRSPRPDFDFARAVRWIAGPPRPEPGVHPSAVVDPSAEVHPSASIGAHVSVGARARVGSGCIVHPGVVIYPDAGIGADCELHAGVVLREDVHLGDRVVLHPGVVIGADGFGYTFGEDGLPAKIPQVGTVVIEDDVEIGANATVDRATLGTTRIRRGAKLDDLVLVAHNCDVGEGAILAGLTGLSGSVVIGRGAILMGQVGVADHTRVGERAFLGARAGVSRGGVPAGARMFGTPAREARTWHKIEALAPRLPEVFRRLRALERRLGLRGGSGDGDGEGEGGA